MLNWTSVWWDVNVGKCCSKLALRILCCNQINFGDVSAIFLFTHAFFISLCYRRRLYFCRRSNLLKMQVNQAVGVWGRGVSAVGPTPLCPPTPSFYQSCFWFFTFSWIHFSSCPTFSSSSLPAVSFTAVSSHWFKALLNPPYLQAASEEPAFLVCPPLLLLTNDQINWSL